VTVTTSDGSQQASQTFVWTVAQVGVTNPGDQTNTEGGYMESDGGSTTYRNVPDVAAVADPLTGVAIYVKDQGGWLQIGGTSASCPIWAGYVSNINAALKFSGLGNLGFFNPLFYSLGDTGYGPEPDTYCQPVYNGSNGSVEWYGTPGYLNGFVYNNTTGNGTIWGGGLAIQILTAGTQSGTRPGSFTLNAPKPAITTCKLSWSPSSNALGYTIAFAPPSYVSLYFNPLILAYLVAGKETSFTFTGLKANTKYEGAITAYNASGPSQSYSFQFTTLK